MVFSGFATVEVGRLFDMPGIEEAAKLFYSPLIIAGIIIPGLAGLMGLYVYTRIKNISVVSRIQEGK